MKFLIAGLGSIGRRHLRNLLALGERDIVLFRSHRSTLPEEELSGFQVETDLKTALSQRPEAVVISNPTALHLDVALPAVQAGCHVLLEKPVSHSLDGIDALAAAARQSGSKILVGFQFRFHPGLQSAVNLLSSGRIGQPLSVRVHWGEFLPGWHPWEDYRLGYAARAELGGGVALTLCHPFDYLRWLLGEVEALWAFTGHKGSLELDVEDTVEVGLRFTNGVIGSVHLNYNQRPPVHTFEIVGTQGVIRWDNRDGAVAVYQAEDKSWENYAPPEGFERNHLFIAEMKHFVTMVRGETEPLCSLQDGVQALRIALGALESAQNEKIVRL